MTFAGEVRAQARDIPSSTVAPSPFMAEALALARRGEGRTAPNPPVGAVVVQDGVVVGRGFHPRAGEPHAEVFALREAGERARGATLYVTLEPCPTHGRTPPCTEAILAAGIARVVVAAVDPNPRVQGRGLRQLRSRGVIVELGDGTEEAEDLLRFYAKHVQHGLPYVVYKYAMSLDGKVVAERGLRTAISGAASLERVHALRDRVDAVLVGVGTVLADNPMLTVRRTASRATPDRQPLRVVADSHLRLPPQARLLSDPARPRPVVACLAPAPREAARRLTAAGAEILPLTGDPAARPAHLPLHALMAELGRRGVMAVLLEGGPTLASAMLAEDLVDEVVAIVTPRMLGGLWGAGPLASLPEEALASFRHHATYTVGDDVWVELRRPSAVHRAFDPPLSDSLSTSQTGWVAAVEPPPAVPAGAAVSPSPARIPVSPSPAGQTLNDL